MDWSWSGGDTWKQWFVGVCLVDSGNVMVVDKQGWFVGGRLGRVGCISVGWLAICSMTRAAGGSRLSVEEIGQCENTCRVVRISHLWAGLE